MAFFLIIAAIVLIFFIIGKVQDAKKSRLHKEIDSIKKKYPLAYKNYISKNKIAAYIDDIPTLERIASRSSFDWNKEEGALLVAERRKKQVENDYQDISAKYPKGLAKWESNNHRTSKEAVIANKRKVGSKNSFFHSNWLNGEPTMAASPVICY